MVSRWYAGLCLLLLCWVEGRTVAGKDCDFGVRKLWSSQLRENPISAPPLLFDVDGDGYDDIVVPSFSGEVWGVHGENGHIVDNWPFYLEERSFHSGPLVYDVNGDGVLEFLLTTTDAEVVFVQTDNILLHGETIKIPPLRIKRKWHMEDLSHVKKMANQDQVSMRAAADHMTTRSRKPSNFTTPFSEFESRFGRHADPLFSRHETTPRPAGLDPKDQEYVYVDPHVLATPVITDTDGDGVYAELVVPVSYYFDPYRYGAAEQLDRLNGMEESELVDYTAGGVVIIDLNTGRLKGQKLLGIARGVDSQPGYLLATPTVVRLAAGEDPMIIIGSVMGELHVMAAKSLEEKEGFPLLLDSITAQVAVGDVFGTGKLDMLVGDYSGIVYCIDGKGKRIWEREVDNPVTSSVRLADVEGDGVVEVVLATHSGDVWVLSGQTGRDHTPSRYPIHLNSGVETSVLPMHLVSGKNKRGNATLALVVPTADAIYLVDTSSGCVETVDTPEHVFHEVVSGDIDPYSPGLELLGVGLDGTLACFRVSAERKRVGQEAWSMEAMGDAVFSHKSSSFYFVVPFANSSQEITGTSFDFSITIHSNSFQTDNDFSLIFSIGRKHVLWKHRFHVKQRVTELHVSVPTPPTPVHAFMTVLLCNQHLQCRSQSTNLRFNLHAQDHLKWFLCLPFLCVCALILWLHREHSAQALPTVSTRHTATRKDL